MQSNNDQCTLEVRLAVSKEIKSEVRTEKLCLLPVFPGKEKKEDEY